MRIGVWVLGTEVFAFDLGRTPGPEEEPSMAGGTGGQFEVAPQGMEAIEPVEFGFRC